MNENGRAPVTEETPVVASTKPWSWDDDDDEESSTTPVTQKDDNGDVVMAEKDEQHEEKPLPDTSAMDEDEVDPLDAFMVDVTAEVKELEQKERKRDTKQANAPQIASGNSAKDGANPGANGSLDDDEEELAESSEEEDILAMAAKRIKRKDIPAVDHAKMNYEPFRKNFYLEPPEMTDLTPEEVHTLRLELDGIKIRGADCPKPIRKWTQAGLPAGW